LRIAMSAPIKADRLARFNELIASEDSTLEELFQRMTCTPEGGSRPESLSEVCAAWDVPYGRMLGWLMADADRYATYQRALEIAAHELVAQTLEIADTPEEGVTVKTKSDGSVEETREDRLAHRRLKVETRFRIAKHHAPQLYGERIEVNNNHRVEVLLEIPALELLKRVRGEEIGTEVKTIEGLVEQIEYSEASEAEDAEDVTDDL
jgi:hypothetical protein